MGKINSRQKGARGERWWRDELRAQGYQARRGQQFSGSPDSPDVVCESLPWAHFEVKAVERLNIYDAMEQALGDCGAKVPFVIHKRNFRRGLVVMTTETFFQFLRGDLPPAEDGMNGTNGTDGLGTRTDRRLDISDFKGPSEAGREFPQEATERIQDGRALTSAATEEGTGNNNLRPGGCLAAQ